MPTPCTRRWALASLPSKQGLKLFQNRRTLATAGDSRFTSIKTRIETFFSQDFQAKARTLASLPSKQGLKPTSRSGNGRDMQPLASLPSKQGLKRTISSHPQAISPPSRFTSIKTRIETEAMNATISKGILSRFTSIKTRIETGRRDRPCRSARVLSLHFHQNKD